MKTRSFAPLILMILFLSACGPQTPACPLVTGTPRYLTEPPEIMPTPVTGNVFAPISMEIGGKTIAVDKVVEGPLCNDTWHGIVYVTCDFQVIEWEKEPLFLKNCNLDIEPGTIVYVASHNNAAYYNGCSCHTGEITGP